MSEFILMLTRNDITVPDANELLDEVLSTGVRHVGFKDIGLDAKAMRQLVTRLRDAGRTVYLEVVSLDAEAEISSARTAVDLDVDYLIGGTRWQQVSDLVRGADIRYFPYPGRISGHPAVLDGTVASITAHIARMREAVDGVNVLAFRHRSLPGEEVLVGVQEHAGLPVISAGSINSIERVRAVAELGVWAFTIGGAALDCAIVPGASLRQQLSAVLTAAQSTSGVPR